MFRTQAGQKKKAHLPLDFFFVVFPKSFPLGLLTNRFRLVDVVWGVEPLGKLNKVVQTKTRVCVWGKGFKTPPEI